MLDENKQYVFKISTNLHYSQTKHIVGTSQVCLRYLQIYTILKLGAGPGIYPMGLRYLQIYTILKRGNHGL